MEGKATKKLGTKKGEYGRVNIIIWITAQEYELYYTKILRWR